MLITWKNSHKCCVYDKSDNIFSSRVGRLRKNEHEEIQSRILCMNEWINERINKYVFYIYIFVSALRWGGTFPCFSFCLVVLVFASGYHISFLFLGINVV